MLCFFVRRLTEFVLALLLGVLSEPSGVRGLLGSLPLVVRRLLLSASAYEQHRDNGQSDEHRFHSISHRSEVVRGMPELIEAVLMQRRGKDANVGSDLFPLVAGWERRPLREQ